MKKPSPALVISLVALFASVSGASYATSQLPAGQPVPKKSVGTKQIKKQAVTGKKIAKQAVSKGKIKPGAVHAGKIADGGVTVDKIGDSAVTSNKIADGAVTGSKIQEGSINAAALAPGVLPTYSANLLYASVNADGTLVANRASGLAAANVVKATGTADKGTYCIESPPITVLSAQATVLSANETEGAKARQASVSILGADAAVPEGCNAENTKVVVYTAAGTTLEDDAFSLLLIG
jgi:hypothetical protein